ncbi:MAG: DUF559 domain-containing protein [Patescibacteria group bacterium]
MPYRAECGRMAGGAKAVNVLVGVLKSKRDLTLLLKEHWYRIPAARLPKRRFRYLAFYQPALFGRRGKCIRYYARALKRQTIRRRDLLPDEPWHPRARADYIRIDVGKVRKLPRPIRNTIPRRVSFGFTTRERLLRAKNILQLYNVAETEKMVRKWLCRARIKATAQYWVKSGEKRYCLDFAVFCRRGLIAIECDNTKAHAGLRQRQRDRIKDAFLKNHGWVVMRLKEKDVVTDEKRCIAKIRKMVRKLGGSSSFLLSNLRPRPACR